LKERRKTLIPTFSRKREKGRTDASLPFLSYPLPLAGEGRVRVFSFFFLPAAG
jgi:hypothetical protein